MNPCCPNAITESRSERVGFYRNEQGGCLPGKSTREALLHRQVLWNVSGAGPIEKERCQQSKHKHMQHNDACTWHEDVMLFELMQLVFRLNEVHFNQDSNATPIKFLYISHFSVSLIQQV